MTRAIIWIPRALVLRMIAAAESAGDYEIGGMLVGYEGADRTEEVVVTALIDGGPRAVQREFEFRPDGRWQRDELARTYAESGRVTTFVGDWHSHPHGLPLPSETDVATAARTAANPGARAPRPLTVILGRAESGEWTLGAFRYISRDLLSARVRVFEHKGDMLEALARRRRRKLTRSSQPPSAQR